MVCNALALAFLLSDATGPAQPGSSSPPPAVCGVVRQALTVSMTSCDSVSFAAADSTAVPAPLSVVFSPNETASLDSPENCSCVPPQLESAVSLSPPAALCRDNNVLRIQRQLARLGYDVGTADGIMSERTRLCLQLFQSYAGFQEDGLTGPKTLAALETFYRERLSPLEKSVVGRLMSYGQNSPEHVYLPPARGVTVTLDAPRGVVVARSDGAGPVSANPYHVVLFRSEKARPERQVTFLDPFRAEDAAFSKSP